jgi:hypothetical protein
MTNASKDKLTLQMIGAKSQIKRTKTYLSSHPYREN